MSEEEKKAIEYLENLYPLEWWRLPDSQGRLKVDVKLSNAIDIALNLIEKQQAELEKKNKIINEMAENIELQQYVNIDTSNLSLICKELKCNKKCETVNEKCIKQYFKKERIGNDK